MEDERKTLTLDDETQASNPGKIKFDPWIWLKYDTKKIVLLTSTLLISLFLVIKFSYYFVVIFLIALVVNFYYWFSKKEHFYADSNGGIIISEEPPLAAVYTNLAKFGAYGDHYPVIKVIKFEVNRAIQVGDKIATVAVYSALKSDEDETSDFWGDFFPLPVEYATNNTQEINNELRSYQKEHWEILTDGIKQLDKPYSLGLFRINIHSSDWQGS